MDKLQHEAIRRMFYTRRCQPNNPEHALIIEAELASLKVLNKHDYDNFKTFYKKVEEKNKVEVKTAKEVAKEVAADGEVTMADLEKVAAAKNANALPLPEDADGEVEEKKREKALEERDEIVPARIDTPVGEPPMPKEAVLEEQPSEEEIEKPKKAVKKKKAKKKPKKSTKKRGKKTK